MPDKFQEWLGWISSQVCGARVRAGMGLKELAVQSGLPEDFIRRVETGKQSPSRHALLKIAEALNIPLPSLDPSAEADDYWARTES